MVAPTLLVNIYHLYDVNAKRILLASLPADWRRQPGRPRITWLSTVQQDLKQHHRTLPKAANLAQNRPLSPWDRQKIGTKKMAKPHYVFLIL